MRIVSYNILDGGIGRADPLAEVLLAQRADVIGLVEADDPAMLDRIAWRLGFDCIAAEGRKGRTAALLTRGRIVESINHAARRAMPPRAAATLSDIAAARPDIAAARPDIAAARRAAGSAMTRSRSPRSFLEATVEVDRAQLTFGLLHTTAKASQRREHKRERELAAVLDVFADRRAAATPHVLMGDFNATSPLHKVERERLPDASRKYFDKQGDLPRSAITSILDAGYLDTLAVVSPEAAPTSATFTTLQPGQRVDFIFTFGLAPEAVTAAWIETDRLATYASDHYPVGAQLQF